VIAIIVEWILLGWLCSCLLNLEQLAEFLGQNSKGYLTKNALQKRIKRANGRAWLELFGHKIPLLRDGGKTSTYYVKKADLAFLELPTVPDYCDVWPRAARPRKGPGRPPKTSFGD
jgi:hypothetical protein